MKPPDNSNTSQAHLGLAVDIAIRLAVVALLAAWCFLILRPFVTLIVWGIIIAVAYYPLCCKLADLLGGRLKIASAIVTVATLVVLVVPAVFLVNSLVDGMTVINDKVQQGTLKLPPAPEGLHRWPVVGEALSKTWAEASANMKETLGRYAPQIRSLSLKLLEVSAGAALGVLQFAASILVAGLLMANAAKSSDMIRQLFTRMAGRRGEELAGMITVTIRNVVKGILGVAIIQGVLAGIGFVLAGVPGAGAWTALCLFLAIIQIGIAPVAIPVMIYMFSKASALTAGLLTAWLILVMLSDNVLKPILLGRGAPVPMPVIFLGAIGGFMAMGFIGLFVGAVVLSLGFVLLLAWRDNTVEDHHGAGQPAAD